MKDQGQVKPQLASSARLGVVRQPSNEIVAMILRVCTS